MQNAISWSDFAGDRADLAHIGRDMLYGFDVGLGFLATVRLDGGPRVHPVCPIFVGERLYAMVIPGPKLEDLKRDERYALHSETFPPPREDDGFYVSGRVERVDDPRWSPPSPNSSLPSVRAWRDGRASTTRCSTSCLSIGRCSR